MPMRQDAPMFDMSGDGTYRTPVLGGESLKGKPAKGKSNGSGRRVLPLGVSLHHCTILRRCGGVAGCVRALLDKMIAKGWAEEFDTLEALLEKHGRGQGAPLSKLGSISKTKADGTMKHRLVWDLRRSGVNGQLHQVQRILLPRLSDVVEDYLAVSRATDCRASPLLIVADVADTFHLVPVHPDE
eukprot:691265-Amphidinium_carterae.1